MKYRIFCTEKRYNIKGKDTYRVLYLAPKEEWIFGETWLSAIDKSFDTLEEAEAALKELKKNKKKNNK